MKRIRKLLAFAVLAGILSGLFCGCSGHNAVQGSAQDGIGRKISQIKDSGYIKVGVFKDNKPFGYLDLNGNYQGFDVYLAKRISEDLGVKVQYVPLDADAREQMLNEEKVDLVLAGYTVTEERAKKVDFASPYMKTDLGIVSPSQNAITDLNQLKGKIVIVVQDTMADLYFKERHPEIKMIRLDEYKDAFEALEQGLGDALCTDTLSILAWMGGRSEYKMEITISGFGNQIAPAVKKDNKELLDWMNKEMETLQKEKFFTAGYEKVLQTIYRDVIGKDEIIIE